MVTTERPTLSYRQTLGGGLRANGWLVATASIGVMGGANAILLLVVLLGLHEVGFMSALYVVLSGVVVSYLIISRRSTGGYVAIVLTLPVIVVLLSIVFSVNAGHYWAGTYVWAQLASMIPPMFAGSIVGSQMRREQWGTALWPWLFLTTAAIVLQGTMAGASITRMGTGASAIAFAESIGALGLLLLCERPSLGRWLLLPWLAVLFSADSRGPLVVFGLVGVLLVIINGTHKKSHVSYPGRGEHRASHKNNYVRALLAISGAGLLILLLAHSDLFQNVFFRSAFNRWQYTINRITLGISAIDSGRSVLNSEGLRRFALNPWVGQYGYWLNAGDWPHNFIIDLLAETGLPGLAVVSLAVVSAMAKYRHLSRSHSSTPLLRGIWYCFLAFLILGVTSQTLTCSPGFWFSLGALVAARPWLSRPSPCVLQRSATVPLPAVQL